MSTMEHDGDAKPGWSAFRDKVAVPDVPKLRGFTAESRHQYEQQGKGKLHDGRSKRRTGRNVQLNLKVRADFKAELLALAAARGVGMAELLETVLAEWKADHA
jgi:hypothetical protein